MSSRRHPENPLKLGLIIFKSPSPVSPTTKYSRLSPVNQTRIIFSTKNGLIAPLEIARFAGHCPPLDTSCITQPIRITFRILLCSIPSTSTFKQPPLVYKLDSKGRRNMG